MIVSKASSRCIILAVDGSSSQEAAFSTIEMAAAGPIGPHLWAVKLNDVLHASFGHELIRRTKSAFPGLALFCDLKLADVTPTVVNTVRRYSDLVGDLLVTVSLHASPKAFVALRQSFSKLNIAAMGVPTDWTPEQCCERYGMDPGEAMQRWVSCAIDQCCDLVNNLLFEPFSHAITSTDMLDVMCEHFSTVSRITPGIRDEWMTKGTQERTTGTADALRAGANLLVMGSQLTKGNPERDITPARSQELTAEQIKAALA